MTCPHDPTEPGEEVLAAYDAALAAGDDALAESIAAASEEEFPWCHALPGERHQHDAYIDGSEEGR